MKFYILCDIEGVASLTCWDEARSANACYAPMAREMALEAAAAARGLFSGGADEVVIEDMHGDGCNIDCALLPRDARLLRGITHDIVGLTGIFDESYDGMLMGRLSRRRLRPRKSHVPHHGKLPHFPPYGQWCAVGRIRDVRPCRRLPGRSHPIRQR